jgi:hypothetical protein
VEVKKGGHMSDIFFPYPDSQYDDGVALNEYNGKWSLALARDDDGITRLKWGRIQTGKDKYADKAMPWKVELGEGLRRST